jgi:hypothetical protein
MSNEVEAAIRAYKCQKQKEYYRTHREQVLAYQRQYYRDPENYERRKAYSREYYHKNKDKWQEYRFKKKKPPEA